MYSCLVEIKDQLQGHDEKYQKRFGNIEPHQDFAELVFSSAQTDFYHEYPRKDIGDKGQDGRNANESGGHKVLYRRTV